ncbi:MAG: hypothetical protein GPJ50_03430 [Candidatus Heimdallarchaeota archaeon]|nr:hypothetical protein [Candidatus Heimdallarchaeota archaeon]
MTDYGNESERVKFGNLKLWLVEDYVPGVKPMNKSYVLYDGNTAIATISKFTRRPVVRGVCTENEISNITNEIGNKQTLWITTETGQERFQFSNSAIMDVDIDYWKRAEGVNYYRFTLSFAVEGGA